MSNDLDRFESLFGMWLDHARRTPSRLSQPGDGWDVVTVAAGGHPHALRSSDRIERVGTADMLPPSRLAPVPHATSPARVPPARQVTGKVIRGVVVAEEGKCRTRDLWFDREALTTVVRLMTRQQPLGVRCHLTHPGRGQDPTLWHLGRLRAPRLDGRRVRADLHLCGSAFASPAGNLAQYVLDRLAADPESLSCSLNLSFLQATHRDSQGREMPPFIRPVEIRAADVVALGDAVTTILGGLPFLRSHSVTAGDLAGAGSRGIAGRVRRELAGMAG